MMAEIAASCLLVFFPFIFTHTRGQLKFKNCLSILKLLKINKTEGVLFQIISAIGWCQETATPHGVWLTRHLMRTQESTNPAVTKGTGKKQWQAKHMSSERDAAKLWLPHTCCPNALSHRFLFRQVILQQDQVSREWGPAGNLVSGDAIKKQSCNSTEEKNSLKKTQHSSWVG